MSMPSKVKILIILLKVQAWLGVLLSLGLFFTATLYPTFVYIFEDFINEVSTSYFVYFSLGVFAFSIVELFISEAFLKRKQWARTAGLILAVISNYLYPLGFIFSIPIIIYLFQPDISNWLRIKSFSFSTMPVKVRMGKWTLQILGWTYLILGSSSYISYLSLDYYSNGRLHLDYLVLAVFLVWIGISVLAIWLGSLIKRRKNWIRILAFFYATYTFLIFPLGTIASILIFLGTLTPEAEGWFKF